MTQSFDEWVDKNSLNFHPTDYYLYKGIYEAGAQSKQAEIDELRKRIKKSIDILNKKPNELTYNDAMYAIMELKGTNNEQ